MDQFLSSISRRREGIRRRQSSYDRTGGNRDYLVLQPGENRRFAEICGAGKITHIWITAAPNSIEDGEYLMRKLVLRMYWDGEETPSVQAPLGDFFGMGHGLTKNYTSAPLAMSPEDGRALNCYFPMPFATGARMELECGTKKPVNFYFYVDYEQYDSCLDDELRFHAQFRRQRPQAIGNPEEMSLTEFCFGGCNRSGDDNYVILEAEGCGHYVGTNMNIHNLRATMDWNWYGEGDDMIFIDGEKWPPSLHGTGTEDYFNTAWCPQQEVCTPYHGIILGGGPNWSGKSTFYRYHLPDPVMFKKSIRVTIEHGHANHRDDDISTTAYWYQTEPHRPFPALGAWDDLLPIPDVIRCDKEERDRMFEQQEEEFKKCKKLDVEIETK